MVLMELVKSWQRVKLKIDNQPGSDHIPDFVVYERADLINVCNAICCGDVKGVDEGKVSYLGYLY